jgi:ribonuclease P protein component
MVLLVAKNNLNFTRYAIAAGRAVGNAVDRNYVKRRLRACIDEVTGTIKPGWDMIFYARQPTLISKFSDVNLAMRNLLSEADLML